jgi:hypothetical protein
VLLSLSPEARTAWKAHRSCPSKDTEKFWSWQKIFATGGQVQDDKFLANEFPGVTPFRFRTQQQQEQEQQPEQPKQPQPEQPKPEQQTQQPKEQHDPTEDLLHLFSKINLNPMSAASSQKKDVPPVGTQMHLITHFVTTTRTPIPFQYDNRKSLFCYTNTEWPVHNVPFQIFDISNIQDVERENTYFGFSCLEEVDERSVSNVSSQSNFRGKIVAQQGNVSLL